MTHRGYDVHYVSCLGGLTNCYFNPDADPQKCTACRGRREAGLVLLSHEPQQFAIEPLGSTHDIPSSFDSVEAIQDFRINDFDIGYAALSSLVSIIRDPEPDLEKHNPLLQRFLRTALQAYEFTCDYIAREKPDRIYVFNGRFASMRAILRACQAFETECVIHERGCDLQHYELFFDRLPHDIEYAEQRMKELWHNADPEQRELVGANWFVDRVNRVESNWHSFVKGQDKGCLPESWDDSKKNIALFTSSDDEFVAIGKCWQNDLYPNQLDAIRDIGTDQWQLDKDVHFFIRVHPNLIKVDNQRKRDLLNLALPNVTIIRPESNIDTYSLMKAADVTVSFGSSVGIEAVFWERPSVLLGPCFYRNLNSTYCPTTHEQTLDLLNSDLKRLPKQGALIYGHWLQTRGIPYRYFEGTSLFEGRFKGRTIYAGMHQTKPKTVPQKLKREARRVIRHLIGAPR